MRAMYSIVKIVWKAILLALNTVENLSTKEGSVSNMAEMMLTITSISNILFAGDRPSRDQCSVLRFWNIFLRTGKIRALMFSRSDRFYCGEIAP